MKETLEAWFGKNILKNLVMGLFAFFVVFVMLGGSIKVPSLPFTVFPQVEYNGQTCFVAQALYGNLKCAQTGVIDFNDVLGKYEETGWWIFKDKHTSFDGESWKFTYNSPTTDSLRLVVVRDESHPVDKDYFIPYPFHKAEYRICSSDGCTAWKTLFVEKYDYHPNMLPEALSLGEFEQLPNLRTGQWIELRGKYPEGFALAIQGSAKVYGLVIESSGSKVDTVNPSSCNLLGESYKGNSILAYIPQGVDFNAKEKFREPYVLDFDKAINFVDFYALTTGEQLVTHPTYGQGFCYNREFHPVKQIITADGSCVITPDIYTKYPVECCPQEPFCDNFKLTPAPSCTTDQDCWIDGHEWYIDFSDTTGHRIAKYGCVNGYCKIVDTREVECTTNAVCTDPQKPVCDVNPSSSTAWTCVASVGPSITPPPAVPPSEGLESTCNPEAKSIATTAFWLIALILFLVVFLAVAGRLPGIPGLIMGLIIGGLLVYLLWQISGPIINTICSMI